MQKYVSKTKIEGYVKKKPISGEYPTKEWIEWSLKPHSEEEIRERVLNDRESVCYSYICSSSRLSEKFIIELAIISLDETITEDNYDEKMKELVPLFNKNYDNRLDWLNISTFQKLSLEFIEKYKELLDGASILKNQRCITEEYIKENLCTFFTVKDVLDYSKTYVSRDFMAHMYLIYGNVERYQKAIQNGDQEYIDKIWNLKIKKYRKRRERVL